MNRVRKKLVISAVAALFVILTALLSVVNVINFALAAEDADRLTAMIADGGGTFKGKGGDLRQFGGGAFPPSAPESPETPFSARYFTVRFKENGEAETVEFRISAFSPEEAIAFAEKLKGESTGWANRTYRYRVYKKGGDVYVTVIDQSRELYPSYRILLISVIGGTAALLLCAAFLSAVSRRITRPVEEADRKHKEFVAGIESSFGVPLGIVGEDVEASEREHGPSEHTASVRRQVSGMIRTVKRLERAAVLKEEGERECDLSAAVKEAARSASAKYRDRGIAVTLDAEDGAAVRADVDGMEKAAGELLENAFKFAVSRVSVSLSRDGERVTLTVSNDTDLPDGSVEAAFDRFVRLDNAVGVAGDGLGLSAVRDAVREAGGRVRASCEGGEFTVRVSL